MPVDEKLLHNAFYGNFYIRELAAVVFAFLLGSIRFRPTAAWLFAAADSRLFRLGTGLAPALDVAKAFVPVIIALHGGGMLVGLATAVAAVAGDCYSPWFRQFRAGSQGIAAEFGAIAALCPPAGVIFGVMWVVGAVPSNYAAIGSLTATAFAFWPLWFFTGAPGAFAGVAMGLLVASRQGQNFARLRDGRETPMRRLRAREGSVIRLSGQAVQGR